MSNDDTNEANIIASWSKNAYPWSRSVQHDLIESRKLVTNNAILEAIAAQQSNSVLDVGCGEGWLVRRLLERDIHASGVDIIDELIEQARQSGPGAYSRLSYRELEAGHYREPVDLMVCNFSLLGRQSTESVFRATRTVLPRHGKFIVQTLHPFSACGELPYQDGWRQGSWDGFAEDFVDPAPWYFRTIESWIQLYTGNGLRLREIREPIHPLTSKPASIIFIAEVL